jgi:hypothetical protein
MLREAINLVVAIILAAAAFFYGRGTQRCRDLGGTVDGWTCSGIVEVRP